MMLRATPAGVTLAVRAQTGAKKKQLSLDSMAMVTTLG
jgi:hypothetical protein